MKNSKRKLLATLGVTAAVATGCGASTSTDDGQRASASSGTAATEQQQPGQPPQGAGGADLSGLASTLGVSETKLQEAMEALRPDRTSGGSAADGGTAEGGGPGGSPPDQGDMAAQLAEALGLEEDAVADALADAMPAPPDGGQGAQPPAEDEATTTPSDATPS